MQSWWDGQSFERKVTVRKEGGGEGVKQQKEGVDPKLTP